MELTTEKGTEQIPVYDNIPSRSDVPGQDVPVVGQNEVVVGYCVLNNFIVVFTHNVSSNIDCIKRFELISNQQQVFFHHITLYTGYLGLRASNKIEAIPCYENSRIQKIYWIDGVNYPRMINITRTYFYVKHFFNFS